MPLPLRPGSQARPIAAAAAAVRETLPELTENPAPSLGVPSPEEMAAQAKTDAPPGYAFAGQPGATPSTDPLPAGAGIDFAARPTLSAPARQPVEQVHSDEPEARVVEDRAPAQAAFPVTATPAPLALAAGQAPSVVAQVSAQPVNMNAALAQMGFEGLENGSGFGAFPTVTLKDDMFSTSDGEKLNQTFACIIHGSKAKYIVKASNDKDAEFKYTPDKVNDSSGRPLAVTFNIWRAQGKMPGEPIFKAYLDATAQLFDVTSREMGPVVLLQIPETSIERFKGYLQTLLISGTAPSSVITQVYLGNKVTSVKHPFWPWAFKKWGTLASMGL